MTIDALVIDQSALTTLDSALVEDDWFKEFNLPDNHVALKRVRRGDYVYLLSQDPLQEPGLLVIDLKATKLLSDEKNLRHRFDRMIRVALRHFSREVSVPIKWQPFHQGSLISVYGDTLAKTSGLRLYFDQSPNGDKNIFAYGTSIGPLKVFDSVLKNEALYQNAVAGYEEAALTEAQASDEGGHLGIVLAQPLGAQLSGAATLEEWTTDA